MDAQHNIWKFDNNEAKPIQKIFTFAEIPKGVMGHRLIHIESKGILLLFGGESGAWDTCSDSVYQYSISNEVWRKLNVPIPNPLAHFGIVSTRCD